MNIVRWFSLVVILDIVIALVAYDLLPSCRDALIQEDQLTENLSVILFLYAALSGLLILVRSKNHERRRLLFVVTAAALLGFFEEISYGESLLGLKMPVVNNTKIDAGHDVILLTYRTLHGLADAHLILLLVGLAGVAVASFALLWRYRNVIRERLPGLAWDAPILLLLCFVVFVTVAQIIDLELVVNRRLFLLEEMLELNSAVALVFCCFSLRRVV